MSECNNVNQAWESLERSIELISLDVKSKIKTNFGKYRDLHLLLPKKANRIRPKEETNITRKVLFLKLKTNQTVMKPSNFQ